MADQQQIGRVALRQEGNNWNAYYARQNTMAGAVLLGSIAMGAIVGNPARKQQFIDLMRDVVSDIIAQGTGALPVWNEPTRAPEHERSGSA